MHLVESLNLRNSEAPWVPRLKDHPLARPAGTLGPNFVGEGSGKGLRFMESATVQTRTHYRCSHRVTCWRWALCWIAGLIAMLPGAPVALAQANPSAPAVAIRGTGFKAPFSEGGRLVALVTGDEARPHTVPG